MVTLEIILLVIGLQLVVLAFLVATILVVQARRSGGKVMRLERLWRELLPAALSGDATATTRIRFSLGSKTRLQAFHRLVDEQLRSTRGQPVPGLRLLCRAVGLCGHLQKDLLHARDPFDRAAAAKTLGRLNERIAMDAVPDLLDSKDPAVVLAAAYATAAFRDPERFLPVFRAVYDRTPITLHGAAELLSAFGDGVCPVIHSLLRSVVRQYLGRPGIRPVKSVDPTKEIDRRDTAAQVVMTDLLTFYGYRPAASTLLELLHLSEDNEVLIHLVKAIAVVGDSAAVPRLTALLDHPDWVVRSQSTQALAALQGLGTRAPAAAPSFADDPAVGATAGAADLREAQRVARQGEVTAVLA